ncbi:MAG TPA: phosphotransferase [Nocardioidaceae bacterium]|nr:phosphotransferase [Nocardioidaceae bacterium]
MPSLHDGELLIDVPLVRALVDRDLPGCASLPLRPLAASGSSNALFRLGDELLVRLPRQPGGSAAIAKEARWLPVVAPLLPVPVPEVVIVGEPGPGYPEAWSVVRWIDGTVPTVVGDAPGSTTDGLAEDLAAVVLALREAAVPRAAFTDPELCGYRGDLLAENLLVRDGRRAAVLDFGGLGVGDPTVDLVAA